MTKTSIKLVSANTQPIASHKMNKKFKRQKFGACLAGSVMIVLTVLSLSHLAHGITIVTGAVWWESWLMAIGIDLGFIVLELAFLFAATDQDRKNIGAYVKWAVIGTLIGSAAFNAFAFSALASSVFMQVVGALLGLAIPGLIFALMKVGAILYLGVASRT